MKHPGPVRLCVAAGAALVGLLGAASPAAADPSTAPSTSASPVEPGGALLQLNLPPDGTLAHDFAAKDCTAIPGGAKADTDGWTFDQPVKDAHVVAYAFVFVNGDQSEVLGIDPDGVFAIDPGAGSESSLEQKLGAAARSGKIASAAVPTVPLPAGVKGGLIDNNGGAWLQTPKGWRLLFGVLATDVTEPAVDKFDLKGVCLPAGAEPQPSASPSPSTGGQGGGSGGDTLPLTGANVGVLAGAGVLLVAVGVALFLIRRRRNSVKFVA
jgi:LPXTG-motif cell wall-anchored protein